MNPFLWKSFESLCQRGDNPGENLKLITSTYFFSFSSIFVATQFEKHLLNCLEQIRPRSSISPTLTTLFNARDSIPSSSMPTVLPCHKLSPTHSREMRRQLQQQWRQRMPIILCRILVAGQSRQPQSRARTRTPAYISHHSSRRNRSCIRVMSPRLRRRHNPPACPFRS